MVYRMYSTIMCVPPGWAVSIARRCERRSDVARESPRTHSSVTGRRGYARKSRGRHRRLREEGVGTRGGGEELVRGGRRHQHDRWAPRNRGAAPREVEAVEPIEADVDQHDVRPDARVHLSNQGRWLDVVEDLKALGLEQRPRRDPEDLMAVDNEDTQRPSRSLHEPSLPPRERPPHLR